MDKYDALIVGAGILGLSVAYHIKRKNPGDRILIIDKMSGPGQGNTARSAAMCRNFFSSDTNFRLADSSVSFYEHLQRERGVYLRIEKVGYLWLLGKEEYKEIKPFLEKMENRGLKFELYDEDKLKEKLKLETLVSSDEEARMIGLVDVEIGLFVPHGFSIDPDYLVGFYQKSLKEEETLFNAEVEKISIEPDEPLELRRGEPLPNQPYYWQKATPRAKTNNRKIKADNVIIAAGSWTTHLLANLGVDTHARPKTRWMFTIASRAKELNALINAKSFVNGMPFTILPKPKTTLDRPTFYIKPNLKEKTLWVGYDPDFLAPFKPEDEPKVDEHYCRDCFEYVVSQGLRKYFPQFERSRITSCFGGQYMINTIDGQPVIFRKNGLIVVTGASGSGIMKADSIGRITAALYRDEEYATLYGNRRFKVNDLGIKERKVRPEIFII